MGFDFQMNQMPLIGNFFSDPGHEANQKTWHTTAQNYQAYRPEIAQARLKALNNQMSMFAPVNSALGQMYGQTAQFDTSQALQNPLTNRMMDMGAPVGSKLLDPQAEAMRKYKQDNEKALMKDRIFKTHNAPPPPGSEKLGGQRQAVTSGGSPPGKRASSDMEAYSPGKGR